MNDKVTDSWVYRQPVKVVFANGARYRLGDELKSLGAERVVLITSPSFVKRGIAEQLVNATKFVSWTVYSKVSPNPTVEEVDECIGLIKRNKTDVVVALGGGSVMDCAKAASCMASDDAPATAYLQGKKLPEQHLPLIAIPTTAGTASEVTNVAVLSDHQLGIKAPLAADSLYPLTALVDPELTYTVPPRITAQCGFDVLCHAIESFWNIHHQPASDAVALEAIRLVLNNLETAYGEPANAMARTNMAQASVLAGLAFSQTKTSSAHACSYPLTNMLGIAHGEACALTIDYFIRINATNGCNRTKLLASLLGFSDAEAFADEVLRMKKSMCMATSLASFNLSAEQFEQLVRESQHPNMKNNPIEVSAADIRTMYEKLIK